MRLVTLTYTVIFFVTGIVVSTRAADEPDSETGNGDKARCYGELGCFSMSAPWVSLLRPFPAPHHPTRIDTKIYFYSRSSPERFNVTLWPSISLNGADFRFHRPATAFVVHGFASSGNVSWVSDLKDNYLKLLNANVFLVDWGKGASMMNYLQVASNTRIVGAEVARFIEWLVMNFNLPVERVHLLGHSLGAHICAYTAKRIPGIGRITGFDPAQPGFENATVEVRLDKSDATFVDILHTDSMPTIPFFGFGILKPYGDVDFYFNGGNLQPGCKNPLTIMRDITKETFQPTSIYDLLYQTVENISAAVGCSHGRSYLYFIDTMESDCTLWGQKANPVQVLINSGNALVSPLLPSLDSCTEETCLPVGIDTPSYEARGVFSVTTTDDKPFCNKNSTQIGVLNRLRSSVLATHSRVRSFVRGSFNGLRSLAPRRSTKSTQISTLVNN